MSTPRRIGRYEVIQKLPDGGMGLLYLATDTQLLRRVVVKMLAGSTPELRERFAREARATAGLKHQNIVTVYDIGEEADRPYIAMEYVDGETLDQVLARDAAVPLARRLRWMLELCAGLGYAHENGIIHRDIKPNNLMIAADGVLKILDFGLARYVSDGGSTGLTQSGFLLGTPRYMSPEQIEGRSVDPRSDIFAVGLVLYEVLSYSRAYPGESWQQVFHGILNVEPPPLCEVVPGVDPALERIVAKCIAKAPESRYQQLSALATELKEVLVRIHNDETEGPRGGGASGGVLSSSDRTSGTPTPAPGARFNKDAIAKRRTEQVHAHLQRATEEFESGRFEAAIEQCEMVLVLRGDEPRALALLDRSDRALKERRAAQLVDEAERHLANRKVTVAAGLVEQALALHPDSSSAMRVDAAVRELRRELERAEAQAASVRRAIDRAKQGIEAGEFDRALDAVDEALAYDPDNPQARDLKRRATAALDERHRLHEEHVRAVIADALEKASDHEYPEARRILSTIDGPHALLDIVRRDIEQLELRHQTLLREEREAEARRQAAIERRAVEDAASQRARADQVAAEAAARLTETHVTQRPSGTGAEGAAEPSALTPAGVVENAPAPQSPTVIVPRVPARASEEDDGAASARTATPAPDVSESKVPAASPSPASRFRALLWASAALVLLSLGVAGFWVTRDAPGSNAPAPGSPRVSTTPPTSVPATTTVPAETTALATTTARATTTVLATTAMRATTTAPATTTVLATTTMRATTSMPATTTVLATTTAPATTTVQPQPGLDVQTADRLLREYAAAAGSLNVTALQQLLPRISDLMRRRQEALKDDYRRCDYVFSNLEVVQITPTSATVKAAGRETCVPKTRQRAVLSLDGTYRFDLSRQPSGAWRLDDVFVQ